MNNSAVEDKLNETAQPVPIGEGEGGFEAVLLDGCLGFAMSMGNSVLVMLVAMRSIGEGSPLASCLTALGMAVIAACALRLGQVVTDYFQTAPGRKTVLYSYSTLYAIALIALAFGYALVAVILSALGLVATVFLFGRFLAALARKALAIIIDIVFMYVGIMFLIMSQLTYWYAFAMLAVAAVLSVVMGILFTRKEYVYNEMVDAAESKRRSIKVKGNNHTLLLLGFMFSGGIAAFFIDLPVDVVTVALGSSVGIAGILSLILGQLDERKYKEALKKSAAFTAAVLLLAVPFFPNEGKLAVLSVYLCLVSLNVIVLLNAIVETSRFDMISPIWLLGQEGSVFFAGLIAGTALFCTGGWLYGQYQAALAATCCIAVVVCAWMQIRVNYQIYPFEPVIEPNIDEETRLKIEHDGQQKTVWQQKRQYACERYKLSPREREILQILLKGRDAKYIMDKFYISQSTAKTHIYNIYRKFGIHSRQELLDFIEDIELPADELAGQESQQEEQERI